MQRDIEFKVFYKDELYGIERLRDGEWEWMAYELNPDEGERWSKGVIRSGDFKRMQYTGLKDATGKGIFEGDICEISGWNIKWVVIYDRHLGHFTVKKQDKSGKMDYIPIKTTKVVGSILTHRSVGI